MPRTRSRASSIDSDDLDGDTAGKSSSNTKKTFGRRTPGTSSPEDKTTTMDEDESDNPYALKPVRMVSTRRTTRAAAKSETPAATKSNGTNAQPPKRKRALSEISLAADTDSDDGGDEDDMFLTPDNKRTTKRRMLRTEMEVVVEIPYRPDIIARSKSYIEEQNQKKQKIDKGKGKAREVEETTTPPPRPSAKTTPSSRASRLSGRSRGATSNASSGFRTPTRDDTSEGELISDNEDLLEYNEDPESSSDEGSVFEVSVPCPDLFFLVANLEPSLFEKTSSVESVSSDSDFAGAEFVVSVPYDNVRKPYISRSTIEDSSDEEEEEVPLAQAMAADDDEEAEMLEMAINDSLKTSTTKGRSSQNGVPNVNGAGPSTPSSSARDLRAAAAERRIRSRASSGVDVDDSIVVSSNESSALSSDDDGGGFVKAKGKGKGKRKAAKPTVKEKKMTKKQLKALEKDKKKNPSVVAMVRAEGKRLGRKLTWVRSFKLHSLIPHTPTLTDPPCF